MKMQKETTHLHINTPIEGTLIASYNGIEYPLVELTLTDWNKIPKRTKKIVGYPSAYCVVSDGLIEFLPIPNGNHTLRIEK